MRELRENLAVIAHQHANSDALTGNESLNDRRRHAGIDLVDESAKLFVGVRISDRATFGEAQAVPEPRGSWFQDDGISQPAGRSEDFSRRLENFRGRSG